MLQGNTVVIYLKDFQTSSFKNFLSIPYIITNEEEILDNKLNIILKDKTEGFICKNFVILTTNELFNTKKTSKYKNKYKYTSKVKSLSNLEIGDYVVHYVNGIGIYNGLKTLTKNGLKKDYLEILYAGKDKLYIPVEKI